MAHPDTKKTPRRRLASIAAAADYADISTRTLRRYIAEGRLTGYRVGPRLVKSIWPTSTSWPGPSPQRATWRDQH